MKTLVLAILSIGALSLSGCAVVPYGPPGVYAPAVVVSPYGGGHYYGGGRGHHYRGYR
jgi:hypothetical protein